MKDNITDIIDQLDKFNQQRIEQAVATMNETSSRVFNFIPTLFHFNHPALPGYFHQDTPYGVYGFQLDLINSSLTNGIIYPAKDELNTSPSIDPQILGIYTMGSTSSIGQSESSDLDVWICISSSISPESRSLLKKKCSLISLWAKEKETDVSFFLMNENRFRSNASERISHDDSGSSQHLLLLDEFYRSAVRVAGKRLLWSLVPPEAEGSYDAYVENLCQSGDLDCAEWIDFGAVSRIPAEEYFGSNLWHLYKSIDSPYKSVLKAILLEAYAWEYPNTQLLSLEAKQRFFSPECKLHELDSYFLMLERVTRYLTRIDDLPRLNLVRQCFYLKTHEKLSREPVNKSTCWRRKALHHMVKKWSWPLSDIEALDDRRNWKVEQVELMHKALLDALMQSYHNLMLFAQRNDISSSISPQDISTLSRKLHSALEVLPEKVSLLNTQISPDLNEPHLSFIQVPHNKINKPGWYLYKHSLDPEKILGRPYLKDNSYLSKLVAWSFFNGLINDKTHLDSVSPSSHSSIDKIYSMVHNLRNVFPVDKRKPSMEALSGPCEIIKLAMFINFEHDPTTDFSNDQEVTIDLNNINIFSFGESKQDLIGSIDLVYRNSWNEIRSLHFSGKFAILDALTTVLGKMHQGALPPESIDVFCYSENLRVLIQNLVYQLLIECIELRLRTFTQGRRRRFKTITIENEVFALFFESCGVSTKKLENSIEFYRNISSKKLNDSLFFLQNQQRSIPEIINCFASEGLVQMFFEDTGKEFTVYVLDHFNKIETYQQLSGEKDNFISNVNAFYSSLKSNHDAIAPSLTHFDLPQYYLIVHPKNGDPYITPYRNDFVL